MTYTIINGKIFINLTALQAEVLRSMNYKTEVLPSGQDAVIHDTIESLKSQGLPEELIEEFLSHISDMSFEEFVSILE